MSSKSVKFETDESYHDDEPALKRKRLLKKEGQAAAGEEISLERQILSLLAKDSSTGLSTETILKEINCSMEQFANAINVLLNRVSNST